MRTSAYQWGAALFACLAATGCQEIDLIEAGQCGNRITESEAGEDCDGEPNCRQPDGDNPCRFHCDVDTPSPAGNGCGLDEVCRRASGVYSIIGGGVANPTMGIALADMDNDGRRDLVRTSVDSTFIAYTDEGGVMGKVLEVPRAPSVPLLGDFTGDGLADLAFRDEIGEDFAAGLAVYRAKSDRTLASTTYSSITLPGVNARMVSGRFLPPWQDRELFMVVEDGAWGLEGGGEIPQPIFPNFTIGADALVGMLVGDFNTDDNVSPCEEVALAAADTQTIVLAGPCQVDPNNNQVSWSLGPAAIMGTVTLPDGYHVYAYPEALSGWHWLPHSTDALFSADFDADGDLDLAIVTAADSDPTVPTIHFAFGQGDGSFHSTPVEIVSPDLPDGMATLWELDYARCNGPLGAVLALGLFNDDTTVDIVTESALLISSPNGAHDYFGVECDHNWSRAAVGHFNSNAHLDVVLTRMDDSGIDFFDGAGDGTFSHAAISTKEPVSYLTAGDFDGDLIDDLAYVGVVSDPDLVNDLDEVGPDTLYVSFGAVAGSADDPVTVGNLRGVRGVVTGRLEGGDGTDDILVGAQPKDSDVGVAVIGGNANRQLHAPFLFRKGFAGLDSLIPTTVEFALHGAFDAAWGHKGMAVLTTDDPWLDNGWRLWRVESNEGAALTAERTDESDEPSSPLDFTGCQPAALDLDADVVDEVVVFCNDQLHIFRADDSGFDGDDDPVDTGHTVLPNDLFWTGDLVDGPTVRDVNADGLPDVALFDENRNIVLYFNDGSGSLGEGAGGVTVIASLAGDDYSSPLATLDFTFVNADSDPELELVTCNWSEDAVKILDFDPATQSYETIEAGAAILLLEEDWWLAGEVIVAGDIDGDGVEDIALGSYDDFTVLRGGRVRP